MSPMKSCILLIVTLLLLALASPASAVSVTISPERIQEGDMITITISDLADGSIFTLRMESAIELHGDDSFTYQASQVRLPFAMNSPRVSLRAEPVTEAGIEASDGGEINRITQRTGTGRASISRELGSIPAGTIEIIKAFGTPKEDAEYVDITLELSGTKEGPNSGSITFGLSGIQDGSARIIVLVDGSEAMNKVVTIGIPTITPTPTPVPTAPPSYYSPSSGTPAQTPAPDAVYVSSLDDNVQLATTSSSISGATGGDIRIIQSDPRSIPLDWVVLHGSYIITPSGASFSPAARLSFQVIDTAAVPFLAEYREGAWAIIPARYEGSYLVADISSAGQYAMMAYRAEEAPQTIPGTQPAASGEVPVQTTPIQTEAPEDPEPTQSAGGLPAMIGALVAGLALFLTQRNR